MAPITAAAAPRVKVGVGTVFPITYRDANRQWSGFAVDVLNEAARREGITLEWAAIQNSKASEDDLRADRVDLLPAGMVTAERQRMFYVSEPWWSTEITMVSRADRTVPSRLGMVPIYTEVARPAFPSVPFVTYPAGTHEAIAGMCKGETDAILLTHGEVHDLFLNPPEFCRNVRLVSGDTAVALQLSLISRKSDRQMASRLRDRIDEMAADGTLMRMAVKNPPIPTASVVLFEEKLKARLSRRLWTIGAVAVAAFLGWFFWARQRDLTRSRRAEAAFRSLHGRLALNYQVARIGSYEWFVPENRVVWSREMETLYGISSETHQHTVEEWKALLHPDDLESTLKAMSEAIANRQGTLDTTYRIVKQDGTVAWIHSRGQYEYDESGQPVHMLGVNIDITEQKRAEEALRNTNSQLEAILDSIPEPVMVTDAAGTLLRVNAAFRDSTLYQTTVENYIGRVEAYTEDGERIEPEDWPINRVRRGEHLGCVDVILEIDGARSNRRFSGRPVCDKQGNVTHAIINFFDITDQKRMAEELRRANQMMQVAMEAGNCGAWSWNVRTRELLWSEAYYRLFQIDPAVAPSLEFFYSMIVPEDLKRLREKIEASLNGQTREFCDEFRIRTGHGVRWIERRGRVYDDASGEPCQLVGINTDITERKILRGLLSTCAQCKRIQDEHNNWQAIERYISAHSEARFSHGLCPDCANAWAEEEGLEGERGAGSTGR